MNRWVAIAAITALFLSGISIGVLGFVLFEHHRRPQMPMLRSPMPPPGVMIDHLDGLLDLTDEQKSRIEAILDDAHKRSDEIRRDVRPRLEAEIDETHRQIDEVLTEEQRRKFDTLRRDMRNHADHFFLGEHLHTAPHGKDPGEKDLRD